MEKSFLEIGYPVRIDEIDADGTLSAGALLRYLQDAASHHARILGVSVQELESEGKAWVLSRLRLRMKRFPGWGEEVCVKTWPSGMDRIFAFRDYEVRNADGEEIALADSAWLIVNLESRRPVRLVAAFRNGIQIPKKRALEGRPERLTFDLPPTWEREMSVRRSDTDFNQHVNHVRYIEWMIGGIVDCLDRRSQLSELEVEFLGEASCGDRIRCLAGRASLPGEIEFRHQLKRSREDTVLTAARTRWTALP